MPDLRLLTVKVIEAKDVLACDKGKSSDPYCKIELLAADTGKVSCGGPTVPGPEWYYCGFLIRAEDREAVIAPTPTTRSARKLSITPRDLPTPQLPSPMSNPTIANPSRPPALTKRPPLEVNIGGELQDED